MTEVGKILPIFQGNGQKTAGRLCKVNRPIVSLCNQGQSVFRATRQQVAEKRQTRYPIPSPHYRFSGFAPEPEYLCSGPSAKPCRSDLDADSLFPCGALSLSKGQTHQSIEGFSSCRSEQSPFLPPRPCRSRPVWTTTWNAVLRVLQRVQSLPMSQAATFLPVPLSVAQRASCATTRASANRADRRTISKLKGRVASRPDCRLSHITAWLGRLYQIPKSETCIRRDGVNANSPACRPVLSANPILGQFA